MNRTKFWVTMVIALVLVIPALIQAQDGAQAHIVMFYSSSCTHCQQVLQEVIPPLRTEFGSQLDLLLLDVGNHQLMDLYETACDYYEVDDTLCGAVPAVMVGSEILIGSDQIEARLPDLIEAGLAAGGIAFPPITGMQEAVAYIESFRTGSATGDSNDEHVPVTASETWDRYIVEHTGEAGLVGGVLIMLLGSPLVVWFKGRSIAVVLADRVILVLSLVALLLAGSLLEPAKGLSPGNLSAGGTVILLLIFAGFTIRALAKPQPRAHCLDRSVFLLLAGAGLLIAGYMLRSEMGEQVPYCGVMGDCIAVQQSPYAWLFGWLPVGAFGIAGYLALLGGYVMLTVTEGVLNRGVRRILELLLLFGLLFSAYLTFLELFVIQAMCVWCLTSAMIMLLMFWVFMTHDQIALATVATIEA